MNAFDFNIAMIGVLVGFGGWRIISDFSRIERRNAVELAARRFFNHLQTVQKLAPVKSVVMLLMGETAFLQSAADLCVRRYFAFPLKSIDSGVLVLTNQRLVFTNGLESRSLSLKDIVSVNERGDAIEVSSCEQQLSDFYRVGNPIIWERLISGMAAGAFQSLIDRGLNQTEGAAHHAEETGPKGQDRAA
jgi:hypothetical protein